MGLKEEIGHVQKDMALAIDKIWTVDYEGNHIEVHNELMQETLTVNGEVVVQKTRQSFWSHIWPTSTLKGKFIDSTGRTRNIKLTLGGLIELNVKVKIDGKLVLHEKMKFVMNPWEHKQSIAQYIEQQVVTGKITDVLPDDEFIYGAQESRLAAGLADQVFPEDVAAAYPQKLVKLFLTQAEKPTDATRKATYEKILEQRVINYLEPFILHMREAQFNEQKVQQEALWLLEHAAHREVLKFAIAALGFTDISNHKEKLQTLARHEEFTGVVLFALQTGRALSNNFVLELCQTMQGWGKVAAIDFLEGDTEAIRHWLLTKGTDQSIMPEYIAMHCIEKGKLDVVLHEKEISEELYNGTDKLLRALLEDDNTERFDMYEYAGQIMQRFVYHAKTHAKTFMHFYTLAQIADYMKKDEDIWQELYKISWKPFQRGMVEEGITEIAGKGPWRDEAYRIFMSDEKQDFEALMILKYYRINMNERLLEKLLQDTDRYSYYEAILESEESSIIDRAAIFAAQQFNFTELNEEQEASVLLFLYNLGDHEGKALALISQALRSEDSTLHYHALQALNMWNKESWESLIQDVQHVANTSADKEVRKLAKQILS